MLCPGETLGMLGGGQLGRMFVHAAQRMGYHVHVFSPEADGPAVQAADRSTITGWDDEDALREFAASVSAVSIEFENIPVDVLEQLERQVPVRPGPDLLRVSQNRLTEKTTLSQAGLPVADFASVPTEQELRQFACRSGQFRPLVVKTNTCGYDGQGQLRVDDEDQLGSALTQLGTTDVIAEQLVDFVLEVSVVGARSASGAIECFGPMANDHVNHILDVSVVPAIGVSAQIQAEAIEITKQLLSQLDVVGLICVEMFLTADGSLLINEIAPRPHNSGHLTIEASTVSQFEQQVRVMCGWDPAPMTLKQPAAMANLLGAHLPTDPSGWTALFQGDDVHLHLYGKAEPRDRRKMGHLTALADNPQAAVDKVQRARQAMKVEAAETLSAN